MERNYPIKRRGEREKIALVLNEFLIVAGKPLLSLSIDISASGIKLVAYDDLKVGARIDVQLPERGFSLEVVRSEKGLVEGTFLLAATVADGKDLNLLEELVNLSNKKKRVS